MKERTGKDAAWLSASQIIIKVITLLTSMMLARFRSLQEYGTYSEITTVVALAVTILMLGLPNSLNYFLPLADTQEKKDRFLSVYFTVVTIFSVLAGVILVLSIPAFVWYYKNSYLTTFAYVFAVMPWMNVIGGSMNNMMVASGKARWLTIYNVFKSVCNLSVVLVVQLVGKGFETYLFFNVLVEVVFAFYVYFQAGRLTTHFKPIIDRPLLKKIFSYSIPIGLASAIGTLTIETDKLMIGRFLDTPSVAIYTYAGTELPLALIASSFTAVLLPRIVREVKEERTQESVLLWSDVVEFNFIIIGFAVAACVAFAPQIIALLYSAKYLPGTAVFRVYALILLFRVTYFGMFLSAKGKTKPILYCSIATLGLNVILNYIFYKIFGFVGPAWASLVSIGMTSLLQLWLTGRVIRVPFRKIFPWKKLLLIFGIDAAFCAAEWSVIKLFRLGTSIKEIVISVLIGAVFAMLYTFVVAKRMKALWGKINTERKTPEE